MKEAVEALSRAAEIREHNAAGHGEQCGHYAGNDRARTQPLGARKWTM